MSKGLTTAEAVGPQPTATGSGHSAIIVGEDDVTAAIASELADRSIDVTTYDDPIVAVKAYDGGAVDCVVLAGASRGVNRIREHVAGEAPVVVRLESGEPAPGRMEREGSGDDLLVDRSTDPRTIARRILETLEEQAVDRELARHDRLLRVVHDVTRAAFETDDAGEICAETCTRLYESGCYDVAWTTRVRNGESVLEATAGIEPTMLSEPPAAGDRSVVVSENGGHQTASVPLLVDGERRGTLGLSSTQRIDAAEREVLADLGTVLGERLAEMSAIEAPTPGEYGFGSPEAAKTAMQGVQNVELPDAFAEVVDDYEDTFGSRDRFLWQWLHTVFPLFELSCIDDTHLESVRTAKLATSMLVVVLDDLGEDPDQYATFQEAAAVPFDHRTPDLDREGVDPEPVEFIQRVWDGILETMAPAPQWDQYAETFRFDLRQVVTAIEYAHHVNEYPRVGNVLEGEAYGSHNMMMFPAADIDLSFSPAFDRTELAALRGVVYEAQQMGRIGNWLSTWERELAEGDVHAGTVLQALADDAVDREDLDHVGEDPALRERVVDDIQESDSEALLLERWAEHYRRIYRRTGDCETVDLSDFLSGMVEVFRYHRASRGLK